MNKINCTFCRTKGVELQVWDNIIEKLRSDLMLMDCLETDYKTAAEYASRLCESAEFTEHNKDMAFLGMAAPGTMPGDARVDFVYRPTCYAAAIMIKAAMRYPELIDASRKSETGITDGETLRRTLSACMLGSTGCGFMGHGYDDILGLVGTMEVFAMADTMGFITRYPELCPEFTELYRETLSYIEERVANGTLAGAWGDDHTDAGMAILRRNGIM